MGDMLCYASGILSDLQRRLLLDGVDISISDMRDEVRNS